MKGTIVKCLQELVIQNYGKEIWGQILAKNGMNRNKMFMPFEDVDDSKILELVGGTCTVLGITLQQAADAFGDHWVNAYAPKLYPHLFKNHKNAREFLLNMDNVHVMMTRRIENARPPRFDYEFLDSNVLVMYYYSDRGLIDFFVGLLKGVGKYFHENLVITKLDSRRVKIIFTDGYQ